jgi:hypothetical protein
MQIGKTKMPIEITQSNDRIAEVTLICDCCGKHIGTRLMPKIEVEALIARELFCGQCIKEKK